MEVTQLATNERGDRNLLVALRAAFDGAEEAYLCVAFASTAGVHLVSRQIEPLRRRQGAVLVVTTAFGTSTVAALHEATNLGVRVRVMNPARGTYHPKVYVARRADQLSVLVGSANLTSGLVGNVEMATLLRGEMRERELAFTFEWARTLSRSTDAEDWRPHGTVPPEPLSEELFSAIDAALVNDPVVRTLDKGAPNRVAEWTRHGLYVETERSKSKGRGAELVPGWMIQLAWDVLIRDGSLTNKYLLANDGLNVKRSSFVCALLARLPGVEAMTRPMGVRVRDR